jgi:hypothetical protein
MGQGRPTLREEKAREEELKVKIRRHRVTQVCEHAVALKTSLFSQFFFPSPSFHQVF